MTIAISIALLVSLLAMGVPKIQQIRTERLPGDKLSAVTEKGPASLQQVTGGQQPVLMDPEESAPILREHQEAPTEAVRDEVLPEGLWLEHLRRTESSRLSLAQSQLARSATLFAKVQHDRMIATADPDGELQAPEVAKRAQDGLSALRPEWERLRSEFSSVSPPESCLKIATSYANVLTQTEGMIVEILDSLDRASANPQVALDALTAIIGTSEARIGRSARETDQLVGELCRDLKIRKSFSISEDVGNGMLNRLGF
jgi:hypothetical protein